MLIFPLKKQWYEKIKNGEKTVEYREMKLYWTNRIYNSIEDYHFKNDFKGLTLSGYSTIEFENPFYCYFQLGYNPKTRLKARILKIEDENNGMNTDLKIEKPVYAIHFDLVKE